MQTYWHRLSNENRKDRHRLSSNNQHMLSLQVATEFAKHYSA